MRHSIGTTLELHAFICDTTCKCEFSDYEFSDYWNLSKIQHPLNEKQCSSNLAWFVDNKICFSRMEVNSSFENAYEGFCLTAASQKLLAITPKVFTRNAPQENIPGLGQTVVIYNTVRKRFESSSKSSNDGAGSACV